jgi:hypothetical protein
VSKQAVQLKQCFAVAKFSRLYDESYLSVLPKSIEENQFKKLKNQFYKSLSLEY